MKVLRKFPPGSLRVIPCFLFILLGLGTENPFFVLLLASFLFLLKSIEHPTTFHFLLSGIFLALTALTRSVILPFAGLAILYLIYLHRNKALLAASCILRLLLLPG